MEDLIKALQIFLKYGNPSRPFQCEHDILYINIDPELVSDQDKEELDNLRFFLDEGLDSFCYYTQCVKMENIGLEKYQEAFRKGWDDAQNDDYQLSDKLEDKYTTMYEHAYKLGFQKGYDDRSAMFNFLKDKI